MPRLYGVRETRDQMIFDTGLIEPGKRHRLFGNENVGNIAKSNLQAAGQIALDGSFVIQSFGVRALYQSKDAEKMIFDHLTCTLTLGDHPMITLNGACLSTLLDQQPRGFVLTKPIIVPCRQNLSFEIQSDKEMMEAAEVRVSIFGVSSRDIS